MLFALIEVRRARGGSWPSINNVIVGACLCDMMRHHRGMSLPVSREGGLLVVTPVHRESPLSAAEMLRAMPTDTEVDGLFAAAQGRSRRQTGGSEECGTGIDWNEFHMTTELRR